ncbi:hypothetical protein HA466_0297480 [Hirschfeldia incana]|nr:hypothetical protein HA466_0297480 [Hirschfeldia incana]
MSSSQAFCDFVEKIFYLLSNSSIKKVSLSHLPFHYSENSCVYTWIYTAMDRGLLELRLHAYAYVLLKRESFTSNTLVKLTLSGEYCLEVKHVHFPVLKSLFLVFLELSYTDYHRLLDGCPALEELFVADDDHSNPPCCGAVVKSESLKRLVVSIDLPDSQEDHDSMLLDTPSLLYLDYTSYVFEEHNVLGLDFLVEARLDLSLWESTSDYDDEDVDDDNKEEEEKEEDDDDDDDDDDDEPNMPIFGDVTKLVAGITNITTLHLSADSLEHEEEEEVCCLWTCQVKVLEISDYIGSSPELKQMKHFLGKLKCLESVEVILDSDINDNSELLRDNLLNLPRISQKCNIQFF